MTCRWDESEILCATCLTSLLHVSASSGIHSRASFSALETPAVLPLLSQGGHEVDLRDPGERNDLSQDYSIDRGSLPVGTQGALCSGAAPGDHPSIGVCIMEEDEGSSRQQRRVVHDRD